MHAREPGHWLYRLDPTEWLAAADTELMAAEQKFREHGARAGVTHCRRAAGMGLNAVLIFEARPSWGRSYMEHVVALSAETPEDGDAGGAAQTKPEVPTSLTAAITAPLVKAAERLREAPTQAPPLVQLARRGEPDAAARAALAAASLIVNWARTRVAWLAARAAALN